MKATILLSLAILSCSAITKLKYSGKFSTLFPVGTVWTFATSYTQPTDIANLCKLRETYTAGEAYYVNVAKSDNLISDIQGFDNSDTIAFSGTNLESIVITLGLEMPIDNEVSFIAEVTCPTDSIGSYTLEIKNGNNVLVSKAAVALVNPEASSNASCLLISVMVALMVLII